MSDLKKLRKAIQEQIKSVLTESDDPKSARDDAFDLTKQARSVAGYKAKIPAYEKALAAHQKAASLMKSLADKKEHLLAAKKLQTDIERFKADINNNDGNFRSDMKDFGKLKNESSRDDELKRLKIQNKDVDLNLTLAGVQGELAYKNGKLRVPGEDKELMKNLDSAVGDIKNDSSEKSKYRKQLLQAWYDGYDAKKEDLESYDESWMEDPKDLDESISEEDDLWMHAMSLGELAFENGKQRVPGQDSKLMSFIYNDHHEKQSKKLMSAWLDGWDARNLEEPVEGLDEADDLSDIPFPKPKFEYAKLGQWYQFDDDAYRVVVTDSSEVGLKSPSGKWMYLEPEELNNMLDSNKVQLISDKSEIAGLEFKKKRSERSDYSK